MELRTLWVRDFRPHRAATLRLDPGLTVLVGPNGSGKTSLLEAIAYLATLDSFRGAPLDALVRDGASAAVVRAEVARDGRDLLIEAEISRVGRNRVQVNRQRTARARDLLGALRVSVFAPDDLALVKAGPSLRRGYLDGLAVAVDPRRDADRLELDRILRQRNALLRQVGGSRARSGLAPDAALTLDVWDDRLARAGSAWADLRAGLVAELAPLVADAHTQLAGRGQVDLRYQRSWGDQSLADAVAAARDEDVRRGVTTVGPQRDELEVTLDGRPARTHASQGEQRTLALALRLSAHRLVTAAAGSPPVLLLDDVFSELDGSRAEALASHLGAGQALVTTAGAVPDVLHPDRVLQVADLADAAPDEAGDLVVNGR